VSFLDSAGVVVLVEAQERLAREGRQLVLQRPTAAVLRVLEITDLIDRFAIAHE
jgi:anti-anti-sigma factor